MLLLLAVGTELGHASDMVERRKNRSQQVLNPVPLDPWSNVRPLELPPQPVFNLILKPERISCLLLIAG